MATGGGRTGNGVVAAGICWMAVDYVGVAPEAGDGNASTVTDATGADISTDQVKQVEESLKRL